MQSKTQSLIEVVVSTLVAFAISAAFQQWYITPVYHLETSHAQNIQITAIFTVISLVRGFIFRRFFNWLHRSKA